MDQKEMIDKALEQTGFRLAHVEKAPLWRRLKCRLVGPHMWVELLAHDVSLNETVQEGFVCHICGQMTSTLQ